MEPITPTHVSSPLLLFFFLKLDDFEGWPLLLSVSFVILLVEFSLKVIILRHFSLILLLRSPPPLLPPVPPVLHPPSLTQLLEWYAQYFLGFSFLRIVFYLRRLWHLLAISLKWRFVWDSTIFGLRSTNPVDPTYLAIHTPSRKAAYLKLSTSESYLGN